MTAYLIYPNGALNQDAIAAEVERRLEAERAGFIERGWTGPRLSEQIKSRRGIIVEWVGSEARQQRNPFVQSAIVFLQTVEETRRLNWLDKQANSMPISSAGNDAFSELSRQAREIRDAVYWRAVAYVESGAYQFKTFEAAE